MSKETLLLNLIEKLIGNCESTFKDNSDSESIYIGQYVLLRCRNAGVHFGKLEYAKDGIYRLSESRRIWYWKTKKGISLSELALYGPHSDSKICATINLIEVTEREGGEIILVDKKIAKEFIDFNDYEI